MTKSKKKKKFPAPHEFAKDPERKKAFDKAALQLKRKALDPSFGSQGSKDKQDIYSKQPARIHNLRRTLKVR